MPPYGVEIGEDPGEVAANAAIAIDIGVARIP
jgi:hypothetical protein